MTEPDLDIRQTLSPQQLKAYERAVEAATQEGYNVAMQRVAEMDTAMRARSDDHHEKWVAARLAEMEKQSEARHARAAAAGNAESVMARDWKGLDNGDQLPSSDWYGNNHLDRSKSEKAAAPMSFDDYADGDGD